MSKDQNVALTRLEPRYRARVRNTTNNAESFQLHSLFGQNACESEPPSYLGFAGHHRDIGSLWSSRGFFIQNVMAYWHPYFSLGTNIFVWIARKFSSYLQLFFFQKLGVSPYQTYFEISKLSANLRFF